MGQQVEDSKKPRKTETNISILLVCFIDVSRKDSEVSTIVSEFAVVLKSVLCSPQGRTRLTGLPFDPDLKSCVRQCTGEGNPTQRVVAGADSFYRIFRSYLTWRVRLTLTNLDRTILPFANESTQMATFKRNVEISKCKSYKDLQGILNRYQECWASSNFSINIKVFNIKIK